MRSVRINDLRIIGYDDVLPQEMTPTEVSPIFQRKSKKEPSVIMPPYELSRDAVKGHSLRTIDEFEDLVFHDEVTSLGEQIDAQNDHILWVATNGAVHYDPSERARSELVKQAKALLEEAIRILTSTSIHSIDLERVLGLAESAFSADSTSVIPILLKTIVYKSQNRLADMEFLDSLVASVDGACPLLPFSNLLNIPQQMSGSLPPSMHEVLASSIGKVRREAENTPHLQIQGREIVEVPAVESQPLNVH